MLRAVLLAALAALLGTGPASAAPAFADLPDSSGVWVGANASGWDGTTLTPKAASPAWPACASTRR